MRHNDLKEALQSAGWRIAKNPVRDAINEADWYAWRPRACKTTIRAGQRAQRDDALACFYETVRLP